MFADLQTQVLQWSASLEIYDLNYAVAIGFRVLNERVAGQIAAIDERLYKFRINHFTVELSRKN